MVRPIQIFIYRVNVVRPICNHLVGRHHTFTHRLITGVIVMVVGVLIAKHFGHSSNQLVAIIGDAIGYGLHGLGLTPLVESMVGEFEE
jgi:uncharacterized protein YcfJ